MAASTIRLRAALIGLVVTAVPPAMAATVRETVLASTHDPAAALTRACAVALLAALTWGWLAVLAGVVDAWRSTSPARALPCDDATGIHRWVLAACGVALTGVLAGAVSGPVGPASAAQAPAPAAPSAANPSTPQPSTAQATVLVDVAAPVAVLVEMPTDVMVRRGDSLWSIAEAEVQPGAGPATVTARWRAIYRTNHTVIGADPDLIHPGQRLQLPR